MEALNVDVKEKVSASQKLGESDARALLRDARRVYVAKGKKLEEFAGGTANKELVEKLLGSTGNLRAPTVRAGKNLLVGFNAELYEKLLG